MTTVDVQWDPSLLQAKLRTAFASAVKTAGTEIQTVAPRDTGAMAKGIVSRVVTPVTGAVLIPFPGLFVIRGTRPHIITPRKKRALHFFWHGGFVFFRLVHHPGTRDNPFQMPAVITFPETYRREAEAIL